MGKLYTKSGTGYTPTTSGGMPRKLGSPGQSPTAPLERNGGHARSDTV
jgi:hypothetical protein